MRPPNKNRNNRNKSGRKPMGNVSSRVYESAGPEGKVRGTPQQIIEKYLNMARDAQTSGDRVMSENFLQHAEHYIRLLSAAQQAQEERRALQQGGGPREGDDAGRDDDDFDGYADRFTQPERTVQSHDERPAHQTNGASHNRDPRDQERPRREPGQERQRDARDQDRPRREGGDERRSREGGDARRGREGGEERARRDRTADQPQREEAAQRAAPAPHTSEALDTIDTIDDAALGPVATPENAARLGAGSEPAAPTRDAAVTAAPAEAAVEGAAGEVAAGEVAAKPAPRRRRRRVADAEPAPDQATPDQAAPDQATAD
ncbi:MAG: DUF4167 domain-containing protein [Alphaproteobacteria bacterium]|nr:DUF4167 domain-containing protein [Alphaproteobacteria bacterium]